MLEVRLSPRLRQAAAFIPAGSTVIDVGTDHAYLPIWLLQAGVSRRAYASDNKPGPLENARRDAAAAGVGEALTLYLCDGLALCDPDSVDTVVIAGMGGETILGILDAAPWALDRRLILQPQTKHRELRRYLAERDRAVLDAALVHDTGRLYLVWRVGPGETADPGRLIDPPLLARRDPLLRAWTAEQIKRCRTQLNGLEHARVRDEAAAAQLRADLAELEEGQREASTWRQ